MSKIMVPENVDELMDIEDVESIHSDETDSDELTSDEDDDDDVHIPMLRDSDDLDEDDKELQVALEAGLLKPGLVNISSVTKKPKINNKEGLLSSLDELKRSQNELAWVERLDITTDVTPFMQTDLDENGEPMKFNINDDFKREMVFYEQAKQASIDAITKLKKQGCMTSRPNDYFAEMAKKDAHMKKLRENIATIEKRKEKAEQNKKNFELRKYGKKVQQQVQLQRSKEKRDMLNQVKKYQKGKTDSLDFLDLKQGESKKGEGRNFKMNNITKNLKTNNKRAHKNKKFGFGGRKRNMKANTSDSHNMSKFNSSVHGNKKKSNKRPGKSRRAANKNK